jgi:hypothetical protein
MGYIKDLTLIGKMECAKCHECTAGYSSKDVKCDSCGTTIHSECSEAVFREISSERRFLGKVEVIHHEFTCIECGQKNLWHDSWRSFIGSMSFLSTFPCNCA